MTSVGRGRLVTMVRSCHPGPCVAVTALAMGLAAATGRSGVGVVAVGAAVLSGQLPVGWHNDWIDAERDRLTARADKPVATDPALRTAVGWAAVVSLACCVPLSLLSGWRAAAVHLVAVALALAYNARLKATVWSWVPYAASFSLLVSFVTLGGVGHPAPAWWGLAAAGLLGVGAHFANVIPDLADDAATGVRGLPQRLGLERSAVAAVGLVLAASVLAAFGPGLGWPTVGLPIAGAVLAAGALAARRRPGVLFHATIAVALIDVGMLVARARAL